jgi:hypothetical protein
MTKEFNVTYCPAEDENNKPVESDLTNNSTIKKEYYATNCTGIVSLYGKTYKITKEATIDIGALSDNQYKIFVAMLKKKYSFVLLAEEHFRHWGDFIDDPELFCNPDFFDDTYSVHGDGICPISGIYLWEKRLLNDPVDQYNLLCELEQNDELLVNVCELANDIRKKTDPSYVPQPATPQQNNQTQQPQPLPQPQPIVPQQSNQTTPQQDEYDKDEPIHYSAAYHKGIIETQFEGDGEITEIEPAGNLKVDVKQSGKYHKNFNKLANATERIAEALEQINATADLNSRAILIKELFATKKYSEDMMIQLMDRVGLSINEMTECLFPDLKGAELKNEQSRIRRKRDRDK